MRWKINHTDGSDFVLDADKMEDTPSGVTFLRRGGEQAGWVPNHSVRSIVAIPEPDRDTEISVMANAIGWALLAEDGRTVRRRDDMVSEITATPDEAAQHRAVAELAWEHLRMVREGCEATVEVTLGGISGRRN